MASRGKRHPFSDAVMRAQKASPLSLGCLNGERDTRSAPKVRAQDASFFLYVTSRGKRHPLGATELESGRLTLPLDSLTGKETPAWHNRVQVERTVPAFLSTLVTQSHSRLNSSSGLLHGERDTRSAHQNLSRGGAICYPVNSAHPESQQTGLVLWLASRGKRHPLNTTESK
jgi:hypothetical protein